MLYNMLGVVFGSSVDVYMVLVRVRVRVHCAWYVICHRSGGGGVVKHEIVRLLRANNCRAVSIYS